MMAVKARLQVCNDRGLACRSRSVAAVLNIADLIAGDNPADYRGRQSSLEQSMPGPVVQSNLDCFQRIGDPILREPGPIAR